MYYNLGHGHDERSVKGTRDSEGEGYRGWRERSGKGRERRREWENERKKGSKEKGKGVVEQRQEGGKVV